MTDSAEEDMHFAKEDVLSRLTTLAAYHDEQGPELFDVSVGLFRDLFELGRLRRLHPTLAQQPWSGDERARLAQLMPAAMPHFTQGAQAVLDSLRSDQVHLAQTCRSALEFLRDDLLPLYEQALDGAVVPAAVATDFEALHARWPSLQYDIKRWTRPPLVYDAESHLLPKQLDGVPLSHTWWTEANRRGESY